MPTSADVLVDTSVAVPLILMDTAAHAPTAAALGRRRLGLAGHALFESFSVLTRLPVPHRQAPAVVAQALTGTFPAGHALSAPGQRAAFERMADLGVAGGAIYDGLVAAAAVEARLPLATRDRRALSTYRAFGVQIELIA